MPQHLTIQLNESDDAEDESEDKEEELKTLPSKVSNIHAQWINKLDAFSYDNKWNQRLCIIWLA